jgi:hypothetical protein
VEDHDPAPGIVLGPSVTRRRMRLFLRLCHDSIRPTYSSGEADSAPGLRLELPPQVSAVPDEVVGHYLDHRFDLLGSGWVQVIPGMECRGVDGHRYPSARSGVRRANRRATLGNHREAARLYDLLDDEYAPIDWHIDFKSGWRWSPVTWYRRIRTAPAPGADIKVPWELARMQHLPQLALAYRSDGSSWQKDPRIPFEYRNQVLDFIAANPPRYGVNWKCTMDVGLRAANWVLAHGLLASASVRFDDDFSTALTRSIREHGRHIAANLEIIDGRRANHYLGNIAGLIFCAAFLPSGHESDEWLAFGLQELIAEVEHQFLPDGGHFEGSTAYHRFALDMVAYPAAAMLGLHTSRIASLHPAASRDDPTTLFPERWWTRLGRAHQFLSAMQAPGAELTQLGDNDSGRLFKLRPKFDGIPVTEVRRRYANLAGYDGLPDGDTYWLEEQLDARATLAATGTLIGLEAGLSAEVGMAEAAVVRTLSGCSTPSPAAARLTPPAAAGEWTASEVRVQAPAQELGAGGPAPVCRILPTSNGLTEGLTVRSFPDFGCFLFQSPRLYLLLSARVRLPAVAAHLHNDQLGLTLWIDGKPLIRDPGTFLYTPAPVHRDRYRSVAAHDTPWPLDSGEPDALGRDLFTIPEATACTVVRVEPGVLYAEYQTSGVKTARRIRILDDRVLVEDWPGRMDGKAMPPPFSPGYGWQESRGS